MSNTIFQLPQVNVSMTLTERVYETIKEAILDLKFKPGSPLVEDDLARQLGTSKTPVRDAFLALERDGLVTKIPYKGTYVSKVSLRDATEIFELRAVLEGLAVRLAGPALSHNDLDLAKRILDDSEAALTRGDAAATSLLGAKFHRIMHERAHNRRLIPILEKLEDQLRRLRLMSDQGAGRLQKSIAEHRQILAALRAGDAASAEGAMRIHLESVLNVFSLVVDDASMAEATPSPLKEAVS
jgi:DNA-binding GntR family transcriptional regulator